MKGSSIAVALTAAATAGIANAQTTHTPSLDWPAARAKALAALAQLDQAEKANIVTGVGWGNGPCVGNTYAVPKIGYPSLCLQDGPLGVRYAANVSALPAGAQAAATWDRELIYGRGKALGVEAKALGVHVQLGPVAGPLGKYPEGGRNWEGFSPDPYLTGISMYETIVGMQDGGVQACAKHYIGNEQELNRTTVSENIDDRAMHELYLWPFADAVRAGPASFMCSYNKLNGTWACENDKALNNLLKEEQGFQGYVMTDWGAHHTTVESANAGLDMSMPGTDYNKTPESLYWGANLTAAVDAGDIAQERLDDMVVRILAAWYALGQDDPDYPPVTFNSWAAEGQRGGFPAPQTQHNEIARAVARDGIVLLKNENGALPLDAAAAGSLAIIGDDARLNPDGANACVDRACNNGTLAVGWGSGTSEFPYLISPIDAIRARLSSSGNATTIIASTTDDQASAASAAAAASTALVFITSDAGEGYLTVEGVDGDRNDLDPWHSGNELVGAVAAAAPAGAPIIVVVHSVGAVILEEVLAHENVVAVVWAGLGGQEQGNALADVLFGDVAPSGKLVYTIAKAREDYGVAIAGPDVDDEFVEGLYVDYRHFDRAGIEPRFEFGFGLSYTNFTYSDLVVTPAASNATEDLYAPIATVTASITNSGGVAGAEVVQLYLSLPEGIEAPPRQLRGFEKIPLAAGESGAVEFVLRRKDASYWSVEQQQWVLPAGEFGVAVAASSRDLRLEGTLVV
ncbi:glycoside hydrolase family 3 protein [Diplodia corticola]|uniref:beta-glucosidase n=1 Tax=Diplodia corticola TaxID=236234 RepID=A0A1J9R8R6_9PEZI|nr:glycoside hydrolase family 3 protein [Diplodia corticola]OJD36913.1 glycoside hydrolase family 3 protein [Diplodia corticola]